MNFEIGNEVIVTGFNGDYSSLGVTEGMRQAATERWTGTLVNSTFAKGGIYAVHFDEVDDTWFFAAEDLKLVQEEITLGSFEVDVVPASLTTEDLEVGDKVTLRDQTQEPQPVSGCDSMTECGVEATDTFVVTGLDTNDESVRVSPSGSGGLFWVYTADLVKAEDSFDEEEDKLYEEDEAEPEVNYIITIDSVTLSIDGETDTVAIGSPNFTEVREAVLKGDYKQAHALMNASVGIQRWGNGALQINEGNVTYNGMPLTGKLVDRVIDMMARGDEGFKSFANFLNLTMEQESFKTRTRLMDFAAHDKLDLTEEGYVIAFKNVREDFMDKHSGTFDNSIGNTLSMRRSEVDDDHDRSCSQGLHVCSPTYLKDCWGTSGRTMRVVVNPKNFVAIPYDYNDSKARVCEYTVVEDVTDKIKDYL